MSFRHLLNDDTAEYINWTVATKCAKNIISYCLTNGNEFRIIHVHFCVTVRRKMIANSQFVTVFC